MKNGSVLRTVVASLALLATAETFGASTQRTHQSASERSWQKGNAETRLQQVRPEVPAADGNARSLGELRRKLGGSRDGSSRPQGMRGEFNDLASLTRYSPENASRVKRDLGIPASWNARPDRSSRRGKIRGMVFTPPDNRSRPEPQQEEIRATVGNPMARGGSRTPFVTHRVGNRYKDVEGNDVPKKSRESHVPYQQYQFREYSRSQDRR